MRLPSIPRFVLSTIIYISKRIGPTRDGDGYETPQLYNGRKERYNQRTNGIAGDETQYIWVIYINADIDVTVDSKCNINGNEYIIKHFDKHDNPDGTTHHTKLYLL